MKIPLAFEKSQSNETKNNAKNCTLFHNLLERFHYAKQINHIKFLLISLHTCMHKEKESAGLERDGSRKAQW